MRLHRRSPSGFTLVEVMIVVAIIAMLAAIAIPNLLRARHNANEVAAIKGLRTLSTALESYRAAQTPPDYPLGLEYLSNAVPPYVPASMTWGGARQGYRYLYLRESNNRYTIRANPETWRTTGSRGFHVDETGVIRASTRGEGTRWSPEVE